MARVRLTTALQTQLSDGGLSADTLRQDFSDWKDGLEDDSYFFGKDALNIKSSVLRHVHMVPLFVPEDQQRWDHAWAHHRKRTSDRYLFYADGGLASGFLLIALLDDPGAHGIWASQYRTVLMAWDAVADAFIHFGLCP